MKRILLMFALVATLAIQSCDDPLGVNDCSNVGLLLDVAYEVDMDDPLLVNLQLIYGGNHTVSDEIEWDFGDGNGATATGRTVQHKYDAKGSYTVTARLTLSGSDIGNCVKEPSQIVSL